MASAYVEYDVGMVWVEFDYNAELIDAIKSEIPSRDRTWSSERRCWGFTPSRWPAAKALLGQYVEVID